jgi:hypothetical protein
MQENANVCSSLKNPCYQQVAALREVDDSRNPKTWHR